MRESAFKQHESGITLIEIIISIGISIVVLTMALEVLSSSTTSLGWIEQGATANDEAKQLNEYMTMSLMSVGGGLIRPWTSIWVEDGAGDGSSDRITFAELVDNTLQCTIFSVDDDEMTIDSSSGCCLTSEFDERQVIIVTGADDESSHWESRRVDDIDLPNCTVTLEAGQGTILNAVPTSDDDYEDGTIAVVNVRTLWLNPTTTELMVNEDFDLDGILDSRVVADRVLDIQAALGYDVSPWDWHITDTGDNNDEWLFNAAGDTFAQSDGQGLADALRVELRMVKFAIVVGAPAKNRNFPGSVQVLNGPVRSKDDWILRTIVGVTGLRNYDIMR